MSRRLGPFRFVLCAAPGYLKRKGRPEKLLDLELHDCLRYRFVTTGKIMDWALTADPEITQLRLNSSLTLNNMEAMLMATIDGHGIAYMPDFLVKEALAVGNLENVVRYLHQGWGAFGRSGPPVGIYHQRFEYLWILSATNFLNRDKRHHDMGYCGGG